YFFSVTRPPPTSTLFPYTTLFRSVGVLGYFKYYDFFVSSTDNLLSVVGLSVPLGLRTIVLPVGVSFYTFMAISYVVDTYRGDFVDRKSTRLNSSHVSISYAVFCLK